MANPVCSRTFFRLCRTQLASKQSLEPFQVRIMGTAHQYQNQTGIICPFKYHAFDNGPHVAATRISCLLSRSRRLGHFQNTYVQFQLPGLHSNPFNGAH